MYDPVSVQLVRQIQPKIGMVLVFRVIGRGPLRANPGDDRLGTYGQSHDRGDISLEVERDVAREAALSQMEILSTADFGVLANADGQTFEVPELNSSTGQTPGLITVDATNPDLIRVDIRVAWSGIQGDQDFELSTLVADTAP